MEPRTPIFQRALAVLSDRPAAYVLATIFPYVLIVGSSILIGRLIVHFNPPAVREGWDPITLWRSMPWGERLLIMLAMSASAVVPSYMVARGVCHMVLDHERGDDPSLLRTLADMLRFLPVAILYFVLLGTPAFVGGLFFVIPGLIITSACAFIIPTGTEARLGPLAAVRRGLLLIKPFFGRVLATYGCYLGFGFILQVTLPMLLGNVDASLGPTVVVVLLAFLVLLFFPAIALLNIMITLFYCEARDLQTSAIPNPKQHDIGRSISAS